MKKLLLSAILLTATTSCVVADTVSDCQQTEDLEQRMRACTRIIQDETGHPLLAQSFFNRGNTYAVKEQLSLATDDYTNAIKLSPRHVGAYRKIVLRL